jgi:Big-like domain-containing protein/cellulase (glycosyl hydrolase family 5)
VGAALRRRIVTASVAALATLAVSGTAQAALPGLVSDLTWGISSSDQDKTVAAMQDVGARWTRISVQWKAWETTPGQYAPWEVARTDRAIQLSKQAGVKVLLMVYNAPSWASGTNDSAQDNVPHNPSDYANFMRYVANRYKGQVDAFELWNEPDIKAFWGTGPNAAAYVQLLKAGHDAVKAVDPSATIVSAGLSWDYTNYLGAMYHAGAKGYFDVLAIHPYPTGPLSGWQSSYRAARKTELAAGDDKPIWFTEFGMNTSSDSSAWQKGVSLQQQADLLTQSFQLAAQDPYVGVIFYYNFRNDWWGNDDQSSMEAQFGLMSTKFVPKPAYYAFKAYAQSLGSSGGGSGSGSGGSNPPPPQDAAPAVSLTAPTAGGQFENGLGFAANASDDKGVAQVRFLVDGTVVATDRSAPYSGSWRAPKGLSWGVHTVTAVAVDTAGHTTTSAAVRVNHIRRAVKPARMRRLASWKPTRHHTRPHGVRERQHLLRRG